MNEMKAMAIMAVAGIICVGVMALNDGQTKRMKVKQDFAVECNKQGGVARNIDGMLNCLKSQ